MPKFGANWSKIEMFYIQTRYAKPVDELWHDSQLKMSLAKVSGIVIRKNMDFS